MQLGGCSVYVTTDLEHAVPTITFRLLFLQRVQDQILQWVREGRWDKVVQEKRNVLVCMQQVLQSCHTLLDSTQIPVDGVVRLLQHILRYGACRHVTVLLALHASCACMPWHGRCQRTTHVSCRSLLPHRPMQQDLQVWASQLLGGLLPACPEHVHRTGAPCGAVLTNFCMHSSHCAPAPPSLQPPSPAHAAGKGMSLDEFQKKFENQSAVAELLKLLRPQSGLAGGNAAGALPDVQMLLQAQHALLQQGQLTALTTLTPAVQQAGPSQPQGQQQGQGQEQPPPSTTQSSPMPILPPPQQQGQHQHQGAASSPPQAQHALQAQVQVQQQQQVVMQQGQQGHAHGLQGQQEQACIPAVALSEEKEWDWDKVCGEARG